MKRPTKTSAADAEKAFDLMTQALALLDEAGASLEACHLQVAVDAVEALIQ